MNLGNAISELMTFVCTGAPIDSNSDYPEHYN